MLCYPPCSAYESLRPAVWQCMSNVCAANEAAKTALWRLLYPRSAPADALVCGKVVAGTGAERPTSPPGAHGIFATAIDSYRRDDGLMDCVIAVVYSCCSGGETTEISSETNSHSISEAPASSPAASTASPADTRLALLVRDSTMFPRLLLGAHQSGASPPPSALEGSYSSPSASASTPVTLAATGGVGEWAVLLAERVLSAGLLSAAYATASTGSPVSMLLFLGDGGVPAASSPSPPRVTVECLRLLALVEGALALGHDDDHDDNGDGDTDRGADIAVAPTIAEPHPAAQTTLPLPLPPLSSQATPSAAAAATAAATAATAASPLSPPLPPPPSPFSGLQLRPHDAVFLARELARLCDYVVALPPFPLTRKGKSGGMHGGGGTEEGAGASSHTPLSAANNAADWTAVTMATKVVISAASMMCDILADVVVEASAVVAASSGVGKGTSARIRNIAAVAEPSSSDAAGTNVEAALISAVVPLLQLLHAITPELKAAPPAPAPTPSDGAPASSAASATPVDDAIPPPPAGSSPPSPSPTTVPADRDRASAASPAPASPPPPPLPLAAVPEGARVSLTRLLAVMAAPPDVSSHVSEGAMGGSGQEGGHASPPVNVIVIGEDAPAPPIDDFTIGNEKKRVTSPLRVRAPAPSLPLGAAVTAAVAAAPRGVYTLLNQCVIDGVRNPMLREWGLVAVRNLCGGEAGGGAVGALINGLKAEAVVAAPELAALGVGGRLKPDGRVVVAVPPPPQGPQPPPPTALKGQL